jgi:hypothetical protein
MPLVMSFIRLHLQAHWLQQQPLICYQITQLFSFRLARGQPLLAQLKLSILWLRAVAAAVRGLLVVEAVADSAQLQVFP